MDHHPKTVGEFFQSLAARMNADAAADLSAVYQFDLSGENGGQYVLTIDGGRCDVRSGVHPSPHVTLGLPGDDCIAILEGRKDPMQVAMSGRLQVSGDLTLAVMLKALFPSVR